MRTHKKISCNKGDFFPYPSSLIFWRLFWRRFFFCSNVHILTGSFCSISTPSNLSLYFTFGTTLAGEREKSGVLKERK